MIDVLRSIAFAYTGALVTLHRTQLGVLAFAGAAVLALCTGPADHVHHTESGGVLVHSHVENDPEDHSGTLDPADHAGVTFVAQTFVVERTQHITMPVTRSVMITAPSVDLRVSAKPDNAPSIHGPPTRITSLRAPPA